MRCLAILALVLVGASYASAQCPQCPDCGPGVCGESAPMISNGCFPRPMANAGRHPWIAKLREWRANRPRLFKRQYAPVQPDVTFSDF